MPWKKVYGDYMEMIAGMRVPTPPHVNLGRRSRSSEFEDLQSRGSQAFGLMDFPKP